MSDDHSPGDRRQPYADRGGPRNRHAETHDARQEALTNPTGPPAEDPSFAAQLRPRETRPGVSHADESTNAADDKVLHHRLPALDSDELTRLAVLEPGTRLEQGGVYLDLNRLDQGPFKALGGHEATNADRIIAKRDTDFELWNRLAGADREPDIERPADAG
jgi:hypothetical protein